MFHCISKGAILNAATKEARGKNNSFTRAWWLQQFSLVFAVVIAVWAAVDAACRIAEAELAAAFIIAAARAELCAIESREQASAAGLPRDCCQRVLRCYGAGGGVL
jgi:hypothetical protein